jgi:NAD(P)-dependent dehydrogenase (short-subunit alcohol dehydrogenase family)
MLHEALTDHPERAKIIKELNSIHLSGRIGKADEIAGLIAYLCSDEADFITGHEIRIDGGLGIQLGGN